MKLHSVLISAFLVLSGSAWAQSPPAPKAATPAAQAELDALLALTRSSAPEGIKGAANYWWFDGLTRWIGASAFAFMEKYPNDPVRWHAALILQQRRFHPRFVQSIADNYDQVGEAAVTMDTEAIAAWSKKVDAVEAQLRAAKDVPEIVRQQIDFVDMWQGTVMPAYNALYQNKVMPDWAVVDGAFLDYFKQYPGAQAPGMLNVYVSMKKMAGEKDEMAVLKKFADSANREAREFVKARERFLALSHTPFEMKFTALDGREVDVAKLRGKVVLIDFWATWCNPCIAELPNVKNVYQQYRDKGFEIIGVSVDSEKDRRKFADLVTEKGVTWPQHFDGKGWDNQYALQYTVTGVPAMFLLDKKGLLVSTDARGEKLGSEVKRLLEQ